MKKAGILIFVIFLVTTRLMAQGHYVFANMFPFFITIENPLADGGMPVRIGTPAEMAGFTGAGPGQVTINLFMAANGSETLSQLIHSTPIDSVENFSGTIPALQGLFNGGNPYVVTANVGTTVEWAISAVDATGQYTAVSPLETSYTLTEGIDLPALTFGNGPGQLKGLTLTLPDQSSTFTLFGLASGALLLFRRRK